MATLKIFIPGYEVTDIIKKHIATKYRVDTKDIGKLDWGNVKNPTVAVEIVDEQDMKFETSGDPFGVREIEEE